MQLLVICHEHRSGWLDSFLACLASGFSSILVFLSDRLFYDLTDRVVVCLVKFHVIVPALIFLLIGFLVVLKVDAFD